MWYTASLLFKSKHQPESASDPLWEEQIILIQALSDEDAGAKASAIGSSARNSYENEQGQTVEWGFEGVERVFPILDETITDGTEVFSRFLRHSEAQSLLRQFDEEEP